MKRRLRQPSEAHAALSGVGISESAVIQGVVCVAGSQFKYITLLLACRKFVKMLVNTICHF
jgi:hypothetical protein